MGREGSVPGQANLTAAPQRPQASPPGPHRHSCEARSRQCQRYRFLSAPRTGSTTQALPSLRGLTQMLQQEVKTDNHGSGPTSPTSLEDSALHCLFLLKQIILLPQWVVPDLIPNHITGPLRSLLSSSAHG